jgi:hypothetical protein
MCTALSRSAEFRKTISSCSLTSPFTATLLLALALGLLSVMLLAEAVATGSHQPLQRALLLPLLWPCADCIARIELTAFCNVGVHVAGSSLLPLVLKLALLSSSLQAVHMSLCACASVRCSALRLLPAAAPPLLLQRACHDSYTHASRTIIQRCVSVNYMTHMRGHCRLNARKQLIAHMLASAQCIAYAR